MAKSCLLAYERLHVAQDVVGRQWPDGQFHVGWHFDSIQEGAHSHSLLQMCWSGAQWILLEHRYYSFKDSSMPVYFGRLYYALSSIEQTSPTKSGPCILCNNIVESLTSIDHCVPHMKKRGPNVAHTGKLLLGGRHRWMHASHG